MRKPDHFTDEQEAARKLKQPVLAQIGSHMGASIVATLRDAGMCDCLGCQVTAIEYALKWAFHGEDAREVEIILACLMPDLTELQDSIKAHVAFADAIRSTPGIVRPDTDGKAN